VFNHDWETHHSAVFTNFKKEVFAMGLAGRARTEVIGV
jgi:hypothetical protein